MKNLSFIVGACAILTACGGGGYDSTPDPAPDLSNTTLQGVLKGDKPAFVQLTVGADGSTVTGLAYVENVSLKVSGNYANSNITAHITQDMDWLDFSAPILIQNSSYSFTGNWSGSLPGHPWIKTTQSGTPYSGTFTLAPATSEELLKNTSPLKGSSDYSFTCTGDKDATKAVVHLGVCLESEKVLAQTTLCSGTAAQIKAAANDFYTCAKANSTGLWVEFYDQALQASQK